MSRYKLVIEYDGTNYVGWQHQPNLPSIQKSIEDAVFSFCQETTEVYGSGRTDAGVHALGQVAHVSLNKEHDPYKVRQGLNFYLKKHSISILSVELVPEDFHARYSAVKRKYIYKMIARPSPLALDKNKAWHIYKPMNLKSMQDGANHLIGLHDFTTFRASECQAKSPVKTIDKIEITQEGDSIFFTLEAQSFLHHQVRNIVGTLKLVGEGKWNPDDIKTALEKKDRSAGGTTAPACGLYFHTVLYN